MEDHEMDNKRHKMEDPHGEPNAFTLPHIHGSLGSGGKQMNVQLSLFVLLYCLLPH